MKPTLEEISKHVDVMAAIIPFFPKGEIAKLIISQSIQNFVNHPGELNWLVSTACSHFRDWERGGGLAELRGLFCTRFRPADGIETYSATAGFSAHDLEMRSIEQNAASDAARFERYKTESLNAPAEDRKPFHLPKPKRIPSPKARR
jgi:hypothetical protein